MDTDKPEVALRPEEEMVGRSMKGAKWMLYLSASALVAGFFTNVLLGRIGPEQLGFYSFMMIVVGGGTTFFVFGGSNVLVNFLPECAAAQKPALVITFATIVVLFSSLLFALSLAFPQLLEFVFGESLDVPIAGYLAILLPILLTQVLVWAVLQAELEFRALTVSQNAVSWFYFVNTLLFFVIGLIGLGSGSARNTWIFIAVALSNGVSTLIGFVVLFRKHLRTWHVRTFWHLPKGFWKFSLSLHAGNLLSFVTINIGAVLIVRELGLRDLGYYRAASVLAQFVAWVPMVLDRSFYPTFTNLVSRGYKVDGAYARFARVNAATSAIVALVILLFSHELLRLFGKEFSASGEVLLRMLCSGILVSAPFIYLNYALVTAHQKTPHTMGAYAVGALGALVLYGMLVPWLGLIGVGVAHIGMQLLLFGMGVLLTRHLTAVKFPLRAYLITLSALAFGLAGSFFWSHPSTGNVFIKLVLCGVFVGFLLSSKLVTRDEVKDLLHVILPGRVIARTSMSMGPPQPADMKNSS